jgi:hypothetical protein
MNSEDGKPETRVTTRKMAGKNKKYPMQRFNGMNKREK